MSCTIFNVLFKFNFRHLKEKKYPRDSVTSDTFRMTRMVLASIRKELKWLGKGNKPNRAEALTPEDEELLWKSGTQGIDHPGQLLNTV